MTDLLSKERLEDLTKFRPSANNDINSATREEWQNMAQELLQRREAAEKPVAWRCISTGPNSNVVTLSKVVADSWAAKGISSAALYEEPPLTSAEREMISDNPPVSLDYHNSVVRRVKELEERLAAYDRAAKEPVAWRHRPVDDVPGNGGGGWCGDWKLSPAPVEATVSLMRTEVQPLYTAPPLPVVPDEVPESLKYKLITICDLVENNDEYCQDIWNACRAAMLQPGK